MNLNVPAILHSHFMAGAVTLGLVSAVAVDYVAFRQWKSFHDIAPEYQWGTMRCWFQGRNGAAG
jgi:hypothetical protein